MSATAAVPMRSGFARRVLRAALLDAGTYEEVEADRSATGQALAVVALSAFALGLGGVANHGAPGILWSTLHGVAAWYVWAWVTYLIGTRLLPGPQTVSDVGELLRTIGFSSAPGILRVLVAVPPIALPVFLLANAWMLVAMVVAVRQALDYTNTWRAVAVCAIGFPVYAVLLAISLILLGPWPV
jgi:hypothetical protein